MLQDYLDENNLISLLREILPKYAERNKKVSYTCEWCGEHKKSVIGYATHVKKCAIEQKLSRAINFDLHIHFIQLDVFKK